MDIKVIDMKNYIEREIKIKYIEGLLNKSKEWQWYINYLEEKFEVNFSMNSFSDFKSIFIEVKEVFESLIKINEIVESDLIISKDWLDSINQLSLYYIGIKDAAEIVLKDDFENTLYLLIYLAKIANESISADFKFLIYPDIIEQNNIYKIVDVLPFKKEAKNILSLFNIINYDTSKEKETFINNIEKRNVDCSKYIKSHKELLLNANCFSFKQDRNEHTTWEEKYISDMISCSYENSKLVPKYVNKDGSSYPNFDLWTEETLSLMRESFNDETANFIIESIEYALYGKSPSYKTIQLHFELLFNYYSDLNKNDDKKESSYHCSSFEFVISFINDENIKVHSDDMILFNKALKQVNNIHFLIQTDSRCNITDKSIKNRIESFICEKLQKVKLISNSMELSQSLNDKDIIERIDKSTFECLSDKFDDCIENTSGVEISSLFIEYLLFLIKIKNKRKIISKDVSAEIVYIRKLWQEIYFEKSCDSMQCFSKETSISNDEVVKFNDLLLENPLAFACICMELNENELAKTIKAYSETPFLLLVKSIEIAEDFPRYNSYVFDERRPNDLLFYDFVEKVRNDNVYKLLNPFKTEEFLPRIYKDLNQKIMMYFSMFNKTHELYDTIVSQNSEYDFLEYSEEPLLGHLTQLFPVVENKIREFGEMLGIPAICEQEKRYYKLKEPSSVLNKIIQEINMQTDSLNYCADFWFIYYCLFSENGLNIRNECLHGIRYIKDKSSILFAFKITLFCLYLLDFRINLRYSK